MKPLITPPEHEETSKSLIRLQAPSLDIDISLLSSLLPFLQQVDKARVQVRQYLCRIAKEHHEELVLKFRQKKRIKALPP